MAASQQLNWTILPAPTPDTPSTAISGSSSFWAADNAHQLSRPSPSSSSVLTSATSIPPGSSSVVSSSFSAPPRSKRTLIVGGGAGLVSRRVTNLSPALEEDETSVFSGSPTISVERTGSHRGATRRAAEAIRVKAALWENSGPELDGLGSRSSFDEMSPSSTPTKKGTQPLRVAINPRRATNESPIPSSTSTPHQRVPTTMSVNAAPRSESSTTPSRPVRCPSLDFPRSSTTSSAALPANSAGSNSRQKDQRLLAFPSSAPPNITSFGSSAHPPSPTKSSFASPSTNTRALITRFESPLATPGRGSSPQTLHIRTTSEGGHPFTLSRFHLDKPLPPISPQSREKRSPLRDGFRKLAGKFGGAARRRRKVSGGGWSSGGSDLDEDIDMQIPGRLGLTPVQGNTPEKEATDITPPAPASHSIDLVRREAWVDMNRTSAETLRSPPVEHPKESQTTTANHSYGLHSHQASISSSNSTQTIRTGSLLHYSAESFPPRWVRTTATLYPGSLVLSFLSLREEPTTRTISLVMCENVRTVPEKESRVRWANPIGDEDDDDDEGEVHYLELFWAQDAGQQPVVIAVESIAERLAWVSSIWDSILGVSPLSSSRSDSDATFQAVPMHANSSQDSPPESVPYMPPRQLPGVLSDSVQSALLSLYTAHSDENQTSSVASASTELSPTLPLAPQRPEQIHRRRTSDNRPPRLSRPKLSGKVNDLRLSVERMLGENFVYSEDGSMPMKAGSAGEGVASEVSSHTTGSSSVSDAERMEDPSPLVPMVEAGFPSRQISQSHHGGIPIPPYSSTRSTHSAGTRGHRPDFVEFQHSGNEGLFSPSEGPPPSLVGSEASSFDMSDLNPSRSASQVQRRVTGSRRAGGDKDGLTYVQRRQQQLLARQDSTSSSQGPIEVLGPTPRGSSLLDVSLARSDILTGSMISPYRIASSGEASPLDDTASNKALTPTIQPKPALSATTPVPELAAIDPTSILQHTSANEAHSAARGHSLDAKLSSVQADVAQLLLPTLEQQGQLARLGDMLVEMGDDLKEIVQQLKLGGAHRLSGETTAAFEATPKQQVLLQGMCVKLDDVLDRLNVAPETPSNRREGVETPRPLTALTVEGAPSSGEVAPGPSQRSSTETRDAADGPDEAAQAVADGGSKEESFETACSISPPAPQAPAELVEALQLIKDQSSQRAAQTQQTSDIARYLNELNSWMEQFVKNGNKAVDAVSNKVDHLRDAISPPPPPTPQLGAEPQPPQQSIMGLLQQLRDITLDLRDNSVKGAGTLDPVQQRLEDVLAVMEQDRQRFMNQNNAIDSVVAAMERQRVENHTFLQAMVVDLKSEIQGERLRFVDAMHHATSVNVNTHVEEFKQLLSQEVARSLADLGRMREEKKSLEQQIAELFAIKVKHSMQIGVGLPSGGASPAPRRASLTRPPPPIGPPPAGPPPSVPRGPSPFQRGASPHHF